MSARAGAAGLVAALALSSCGFDGAQSLPLPGAAGDGGYTVTITFEDAANLVPKETCRANDTVVGSVVSVELDESFDAEVVCRIERTADLPGNVRATLRETSLLGERYVALDVPAGEEPTGTLADGAVIPVSDTVVHPNTEIVLGALSQVLNGGSLGSISTISRELSTALDGRAGQARSAARRLDELLTSLDANRATLVATLAAMGDLSTTLSQQRDVLADTLDRLPAGLAVLDRQRPRLTRALQRLARLSRTVVPLVQQSRDNTVADLEHLRPVLEQLAVAGEEIAPTLERITSFPFNRNTLSTIKSDYQGAYVQANFDLDTVLTLLADLEDQTPGQPDLPDDPELPGLPGLPTVPGLPGLPALPGLQEAFDVLGQQLAQRASGQRPGVVDDRLPASLADLMAGPAR
ncbi:hypothetical protein NSZ01_10800 [Nocardioides szechwanensis]|uniref:Phospholipid/cholesterol/gamma-HCH transport system substrate-binding protein n=1 Tax=Nocardioides szechwanensis TaxID=1005944 RepID=A0A1H0CWB1_9ACTN|nr:MCE family protein [Nocardioides szechwanensis]GEP33312.1 hypothetical protein NSZ01_10800 [Nocardioides szechwanensis]SDN62066.1 phospholipid/cholesterol/gamma-HCH transport system substrate-binding protein [Nocardioides szechwanensis]